MKFNRGVYIAFVIASVLAMAATSVAYAQQGEDLR
jgi:hypothetical protein